MQNAAVRSGTLRLIRYLPGPRGITVAVKWLIIYSLELGVTICPLALSPASTSLPSVPRWTGQSHQSANSRRPLEAKRTIIVRAKRRKKKEKEKSKAALQTGEPMITRQRKKRRSGKKRFPRLTDTQTTSHTSQAVQLPSSPSILAIHLFIWLNLSSNDFCSLSQAAHMGSCSLQYV